jgi:uncharacterized membrane protein YciS (DUF1049 family)
MNNIAHAIQTFFANADQDLSAYLAALTAIGIATMALIQAAKDLFPLRRSFQGRSLDRWLDEGANEAMTALKPALLDIQKTDVLPDAAKRDLLTLAVDGDRDALLDLPIEQMCGQMNAAFQVVIDNPRRYADLFVIAASRADVGDVSRLVAHDRSHFAPEPKTPTQQADQMAWVDARNRVAQQLQRAVDGFQIATGYRWKLWLQIASFLVSALLVALAVGTQGDQSITSHIGVILFSAVLAGFLAPVARDLTAALQRLRG